MIMIKPVSVRTLKFWNIASDYDLTFIYVLPQTDAQELFVCWRKNNPGTKFWALTEADTP